VTEVYDKLADEADAPARRRLPRPVITVASVVVALLLWEIAGRQVNPVFISYPSAIVAAFWSLSRSGQLWAAFVESLQPFAIGYGLAVGLGAPLGLMLGRFRLLEAAFGIYVTAGFAMPLVALVPLLTLWLGLGFSVKVAIIFLMAFFPVCINAWAGVSAVPKSLIDVAKSFVASDAVILRRIILPATLPYIVTGMKLAIGRAVVGMIIAEFFTAISGLGAIVINAANNFDTATMFVPILLLVVLAIGLTALIGLVERRVAPWQAEIAGRNE
jgi:NitT/TauT family transport system permease protein